MERNKIIEELYQAVETFGLMPTIGKFFGVGTRIRIPFSESACNTKLEDLDWSVRSYNCLKRAGYKTLDQVIDAMMQNTLCHIRNLGKNSRAEIRVRILEYGYSQLSEKDRKAFVKTLFDLNEDKFIRRF